MAISEMTGDMSCELDMWDAKDSAEYQAKVKDKRRPRRSGLSLRDFMKAIMQDELSGAKMNLLGAATMSDLNLASLGEFRKLYDSSYAHADISKPSTLLLSRL